MAKKKTKDVRLYPYVCNIPNKYTADTLEKKFAKGNLKNVVVKYGEDFLGLTIDKQAEGKLFGRFMRLRHDAPDLVKLSTGNGRTIKLDSDENVRETSHFIWSATESIILGEYNHSAVRQFSVPLNKYFTKVFDTEQINISPIPNKDSFSFLKKEKSLRKYTIKIAEEKLTSKEKNNGILALLELIKVSTGKSSVIEVSVRKTSRKENDFNKAELIKLAKALPNDKTLKAFHIYSQHAKYDLLNNNMLYFIATVTVKSRKVDTNSVYNEAEEIFNDKIDIMKKFK